MGIFFLDYAPHSLDEWAFQKKDTHTLDFDVTLCLGLKRLTSLIFSFAKGFWDFPLGNSLFRG
ncbi:MAG: hypothetical protein JRJ77_03580 [Deltaproteobacteria bacterium]|nr:hypothetical protein [Deltaproteobacteria bacterium]